LLRSGIDDQISKLSSEAYHPGLPFFLGSHCERVIFCS